MALTVTEQVAVKPPSSVVTVIVAVPDATAVTLPVLSTVAIDESLEVQLTFLFDALDGVTVAVSTVTSPSVSSTEVLSKVTPVTG